MDAVNRPTVRKSLPLSERDLRNLEVMRGSTVHRMALSRLADVEVTESTSEATLLHAVLEAGLKAVECEVEAQGYAQAAAEMDAAARRATARRRRPAWADE